ncbi:MAG TPA: DUF3047 domain-containing protein [Caldimonas sp.]|jgi:hypothetical protein|nr:DUF3047 domain-containing protein [Caldimonas sp.]
MPATCHSSVLHRPVALGWSFFFLATGSALAADPVLAPFGASGGAPQAPWHVVGLPQQTKPFTRFSVVDIDGKRAVKIEADESYGNLVHPVQAAAPAHLAWQWRIEKPLENADLRQRSGDDTAVKVCVSFDLPIESISFAERQILRIARGKTSEPVPGASVCYVWDAKLAAGTALDNAFTRRIRYIVLESGNDRLDRWVGERRDVGADFLRLFKDESTTVPPIIGVAIGADADNTKSHTVSYVSGVTLEP